MLIPKFEETVNNKSESKIKCWVYGEAFSGKTTLADTFPKPLFLNTDGNVKNVKHPVIPFADKVTKEGRVFKTSYLYDDFKKAVQELSDTSTGYETIVVDLLEDIYESCRKSTCKKYGWMHESDDSFKAYDIVRNEFLGTLKMLMALPYNVVLLSHDDKSKDITKRSGDKVTAIQPKIAEKLASKICGMVDFTAYLDNYELIFKSDSNILTGNRMNFEGEKVKPNYEAITELYK